MKKQIKKWQFAIILAPNVISKATEGFWRAGLAGYKISAPVRWDAQQVFDKLVLRAKEFKLLIVDIAGSTLEEKRDAQILLSAILYSKKNLISRILVICDNEADREEYWAIYARAHQLSPSSSGVPELEIKIVTSWLEHRVQIPFEIMRFFGRT